MNNQSNAGTKQYDSMTNMTVLRLGGAGGGGGGGGWREDGQCVIAHIG